MCGIVGYLGKQQAAPILLDGLSKLEYRGYDSAGICVFADDRFCVEKTKGRLAALSELTEGGRTLPGSLGIGHTRWATHGAPSRENSHPHVSSNGKICLVHNGIIENYQSLKTFLLEQGKTFSSETDTEVAANLIEYYYEEEGDLLKAARRASQTLVGSYALGILCIDEPGSMLAMKKESPLIFGFGEGENFIASDAPAILKYTRKVVYLNNGDMVRFTAEGATFYNALGEECVREPEYITWEMTAAEKGGYPHFMLKEIHEQPKALRDTLKPRMKEGRVTLDDLRLTEEYLRGIRRIYIVACGSAYYVGCIGKYILEKTCRIPVEPMLASEFRYCEPVLGDDTLVIIISQSGETADTLAALREARSLGAKIMALTNAVGSTIAREAGKNVMYTYAGPEIAVASTKAYITQVEVMLLLAADLAVKRGVMAAEDARAFLADMAAVPALAEAVLTCESDVQRFTSRYYDRQHVFYIGRGVDNALAMEASLKLKEVSYIMSEAYAAGELKHGTIALIEPGTLVCALLTQKHLADKTLSNVREVRSRGARTMIVCPESLREKAASEADELWCFPDCRSELTPLLAIIPVQLLAYYMAVNRGCDVDKPRNLAKSVTVE